VQKGPKSKPEIMHIDRLIRYHGTVPKARKSVLANEEEMVLEMTVDSKEACASTDFNRNYPSILHHFQVIVS